MMALFTSISNRMKAIYLIWFTVHFILFISSGNIFSYCSDFYPYTAGYYSYTSSMRGGLTFILRVYDYSEFLIYIFTPILFYMIIRLWNKK